MWSFIIIYSILQHAEALLFKKIITVFDLNAVTVERHNEKDFPILPICKKMKLFREKAISKKHESANVFITCPQDSSKLFHIECFYRLIKHNFKCPCCGTNINKKFEEAFLKLVHLYNKTHHKSYRLIMVRMWHFMSKNNKTSKIAKLYMPYSEVIKLKRRLLSRYLVFLSRKAILETAPNVLTIPVRGFTAFLSKLVPIDKLLKYSTKKVVELPQITTMTDRMMMLLKQNIKDIISDPENFMDVYIESGISVEDLKAILKSKVRDNIPGYIEGILKLSVKMAYVDEQKRMDEQGVVLLFKDVNAKFGNYITERNIFSIYNFMLSNKCYACIPLLKDMKKKVSAKTVKNIIKSMFKEFKNIPDCTFANDFKTLEMAGFLDGISLKKLIKIFILPKKSGEPYQRFFEKKEFFLHDAAYALLETLERHILEIVETLCYLSKYRVFDGPKLTRALDAKFAHLNQKEKMQLKNYMAGYESEFTLEVKEFIVQLISQQ